MYINRIIFIYLALAVPVKRCCNPIKNPRCDKNYPHSPKLSYNDYKIFNTIFNFF